MDFFSTVKRTMATPRHQFLPFFSLALLFAPLVRGQEAAKSPVFAVRTTRGDLVKGTWRQLKSDGSVRLGEADGTLIPGPEVLSVRRVDVPLPPLPMDNHLILANGDRIPFRDLRLVGEKFHFRHANLEDGKE